MREIIKNALKKAIRNFFNYEDLIDEAFIREAAEDYVFNHDQDIKEALRDNVDLTYEFDDVLTEIDPSDIW